MPHDPIRNALAELVRLKGIKECIEAGKASNIERGEYSFLKEAAWENARAALAAPAAPQIGPSDEEILKLAWHRRLHYEDELITFGRALLSRYGAAPQGGEDVVPALNRIFDAFVEKYGSTEYARGYQDCIRRIVKIRDASQPAGRDAREVPDEP